MTNRRPSSLFIVLALYLGLLAGAARAGGVVGNGSTSSCTDAVYGSGPTVGGPGVFNPDNVALANSPDEEGASPLRTMAGR